jgi:LPXTG-motif cell wall-anchored protein
LKLSTTVKLAIVAVIALLFGGLALRAAMRLVSTATHSLFFGVLLLVIVVWVFAKRKKESDQ